MPIAVKAGIRRILCFEINHDSVMALRRNVEQNSVSDRCEVKERRCCDNQIVEGDNRVTTLPYHDVADRVLLGLLPSSREGWPLAMRLLKPKVGMVGKSEA